MREEERRKREREVERVDGEDKGRMKIVRDIC